MGNDQYKDYNDFLIEHQFHHVMIIANDAAQNKVIVPNKIFAWHTDETINYYNFDSRNLALDDIKEQLFDLGYNPVFYVWYETDEMGTIFMYNNHSDFDYWLEHGKTNGFAWVDNMEGQYE